MASFKTLPIDVVIGQSNPDQHELVQLAQQFRNVTLHCQISNIADILSQATLAIGAGGTNLWERLCLGIPSITITTANNQVSVAEALAQNGVHLYLGHSTQTSNKDLLQAVNTLMTQKYLCKSFSQNGFNLVDGLGAQRISKWFKGFYLTFRVVQTQDMNLLYEWRNHPKNRQYALNPETIPYETHQTWFKNILADPKRKLIIGYYQGTAIGVVRFDRTEANAAVISIYLVPEHHGKGWGSLLIETACQWYKNQEPTIKTIQAVIENQNIASIKAFEEACFMPNEHHYSFPL